MRSALTLVQRCAGTEALEVMVPVCSSAAHLAEPSGQCAVHSIQSEIDKEEAGTGGGGGGAGNSCCSQQCQAQVAYAVGKIQCYL